MLPLLTLTIFSSLFFLCLVIVGLIGNITVCFVMVHDRRFKEHPSNFMLFHLEITDIAYPLIVVPVQWTAVLFPFGSNPTMFCKVSKTFINMFSTAVFISLVFIAFDRHQSITNPFQRLRQKLKFHRYLLAVWGLFYRSAADA